MVLTPLVRETDVITRERLLRAAARLFAAQGFARVTVRDICAEAGANVSAVNYHFGDKRTLYDEVLDRAAATIHETTELARSAALGRPADERLRVYIRTFLERAAMADPAAAARALAAAEETLLPLVERDHRAWVDAVLGAGRASAHHQHVSGL